MIKHQISRRTALSTLAVMVVSLSTGRGARATDNAFWNGGHGSKANFKKQCAAEGGTFSEDNLGNTSCHHKDGAWEECDANGNDCWVTPAPRTAPTDPWGGPTDGVDDDIAGSPSPVVTSPTVPDAQPGVTLAADYDQNTTKGKKRKGKKGGKRRK